MYRRREYFTIKGYESVMFWSKDTDADLLPSISEFVESISGNDVATDELHRRIALWGLLPKNRAGEYRVVPALLPKINFNLHVQTDMENKFGQKTQTEWWKTDAILRLQNDLRAAHLCVSKLHCTVSAQSPAWCSSTLAKPCILTQNWNNRTSGSVDNYWWQITGCFQDHVLIILQSYCLDPTLNK